MAKKIEIIGQALVITDTAIPKVLFDAPKGELYYDSNLLINDGIIKINNIDALDNAVNSAERILLSDAIDTTDTPFTESSFITFVRENLGFKTASGGSGAVSSVFGRTGGVSAQSGDYDAGKITETATRVFVTPAEKAAIGSGAVSSYSETFGDGVLSTVRITHNLNTTDFTHRVKEVATGRDAGVTVKDFDANNVDVESGVAIGLNELRITIIKS